MLFLGILLLLFLISLGLAFRSLYALSKSEEIGTVKQELKKGKVLYQEDTAKPS